MSSPQIYLIESLERSSTHRVWWRPDSRGYTIFPAQAGRYTKEEALDICKSGRERMWCEDRVRAHTVAVVIRDGDWPRQAPSKHNM